MQSAEPPIAPPGSDDVPETEQVGEQVATAEPPVETTVTADKAHLSVSIAAVGDMMLGTDYPNNHLPDDDGEAFLAAVSATLKAADITFGNLEGVLVDGGEPAKKCSNPNACYLFRSPTRYAAHLRKAGFDVMSLANNHARDFGEDGRRSSADALAAEGITNAGGAGSYGIVYRNGLSVAFIAFAVTKGSNMMLDYADAFRWVGALSPQYDILVVSFHGGAEGTAATRIPFAEEEYYGEPRGDVVRFARGVVDAGADLVIGHGPHVVRGIERYKDRLIAYSLGNFATYYGISVAGIKGIAPILTATLDGNGRFIGGEIVSTRQIRPAGPSIDSTQRALNMIRELSIEDFGNPGLRFHADGRVSPDD